jgi:hypothetical protein
LFPNPMADGFHRIGGSAKLALKPERIGVQICFRTLASNVVSCSISAITVSNLNSTATAEEFKSMD